MSTLELFDIIFDQCLKIFINKNQDYGASWRVMRPSSITDQILIKAARIRSIEESQTQKVDDPVDDDYRGIINYSVMAILQLQYLKNKNEDYSLEKLSRDYETIVAEIRKLLENKNSDYGEIWKSMRISSYTDLILVKLERLNTILDNKGKVEHSEGMESHYQDIINYSVFALIKLGEYDLN